MFVTVANGVAPIDLTPASRRQDHTTWPSALASFVDNAAASTASRPYVRDDRETPLCVGRDGRGYRSDLGKVRIEIFLQMGLDSQFTDLPVGQNQHRSTAAHSRRLAGPCCPNYMATWSDHDALPQGSVETVGEFGKAEIFDKSKSLVAQHFR